MGGMTDQRHPSLIQLDSAADMVGGYRTLSALTEIPRTTMRSWKIVPAEACVKIESATGGKMVRQQIRPDLWPAPSVVTA
jgi:DNA-binding transcriptional regulator YdaS (Cro superfamily)